MKTASLVSRTLWSSLAFCAALSAPAAAQTPAPAAPRAAPPAPATAPTPAVAPAEPPPAVPPPAASAPPATSPAPAVTEPTTAAPPSEPAVAPAAPPPAASGEAAASDAALDELLAQDAAGKAAGEYKLDIYGFADATYTQILNKKIYPAPPYNSFAVGRLNVYLASELGEKWRTLMEVRFTYLPNGTTTPDGVNWVRTDTTANDYTDIGRPVRWGGIILERAWLEYAAHPLLTIRAGHWLTPYGIWNVDHGSPVIVGVHRPYIIGDALFPTSQTGLEIYGKQNFSAIDVGYHLTLSNGRGPIDTYQDLNNNKAFGGRLYGHADTPAGSFTLGASVYEGHYTDRDQVLTPTTDGGFAFAFPKTSDYQEVSWAADLKWEWEGFLLQGEGIFNDIAYRDVRPVQVSFGGPPAFQPDVRRWGAYGLTGYRFDLLWNVMPYGEIEYYDSGAGSLGKTAEIVAGLNFRPTPRVVLKSQWTYAWFPKSAFPPGSHYNVLDFQAAWSF